MPILPLGGSARQKRHIGGRSRSSSDGSPMRVRLDVARVHPLVEQVDGLALARAVHAADQDNDREGRLVAPDRTARRAAPRAACGTSAS